MRVLFAILIVFVGVNALTDEQLRKVEEHTKICSQNVGIDYDAAAKFRFAVSNDDSKANQCFVKCFFERSGFMNPEGELQKDVMLAKLGLGRDDATKAKLFQLIEKCTLLNAEDVCSKAYLVHNCYWSHINPSK